MKYILILFLLCSHVFGHGWEDVDGNRLNAELINFKDGIVYLKTSEGKIVKVLFAKLIQENQKFINEWQKENDRLAKLPQDHELYPVKQNNKYGYVNRKGQVVLNFKYDTANHFSDRMALVSINGEYGFIESNGFRKIGFNDNNYSLFKDFSEGVAPFKTPKGLWGYLDKKGQVVIQAAYQDAFSFSDGYGLVETLEGNRVKVYEFLDELGRKLVGGPFLSAFSFSEGVACVEPNKSPLGCIYIDTDGKQIFEGSFLRGSAFSNGMAKVQFNNGDGAFVNREGKVVSQFKGTSTQKAITDSNSWFTIVGYKNLFHKLLQPYGNGVTPINVKNDEWMLMTKIGSSTGRRIRCDKIFSFSEGVARFSRSQKFGFIDTKGVEIIKPIYEDALDCKNGFIWVKLGLLQFLLDKKGNIIWKGPS